MRLALCAFSTIVTIAAHAEELTLPDEMSLEDLNQTRGGQSIELDLFHTTSDIDGLLADNVASHTVSGNNILSPGVFADSAGISNVIQNTGNNVLIQNATVVNLTLK